MFEKQNATNTPQLINVSDITITNPEIRYETATLIWCVIVGSNQHIRTVILVVIYDMYLLPSNTNSNN